MGRKVVTRREFIIRRLLIIFGCVLSIAVILAASVKIVTILGEKRLTKNANTEGPTLTVDADSALKNDSVYSTDWKEGWVSLGDKVYEYNDEIRTILIMGIDNAHNDGNPELYDLTSGGQADALFLVILNPLDKSIKILAVNRDTQVDINMVGVGEDGGDVIIPAEICIQHAFGGGGELSCELTRDAVSKLLFNLPIHGYMSVNYQAIPGINDAVSGVTLTIPEGMTDAEPVNSKWTPGNTITLKGNEAYDFVHYRDCDIFESQRMRLARQKLYLKSFIAQMKSSTKKDITLPINVYNNMKEYIVTDLSIDTIGYMVSEYVDYSFNEDDIYMMEGETVLESDEYEHFYPDEEALRELVIKLFYKEVDR